MRIPNAEHAVVDISKLEDYCLSRTHPRGRHKARVFESILGLTANDAEALRMALLEAARTQPAMAGSSDEYGRRYTVDFALSGSAGSGRIRSSWIVRSGEALPRLVTCYVLLEG